MRPNLLTLFAAALIGVCALAGVSCEPAPSKRKTAPYSVGSCSNLPSIPFDGDSILRRLKGEKEHLKSTRQDTSALIPLISQMIGGRIDPWALFPFQNFDSVVYVTVEGYTHTVPGTPDKKTFTSVRKLCPEKVSLFNHLVNTPFYFGSEVCNNPIPEAQVIYYKSGRETASVSILCGGKALKTSPWSSLLRNGALNEEGLRMFAALKLGE